MVGHDAPNALKGPDDNLTFPQRRLLDLLLMDLIQRECACDLYADNAVHCWRCTRINEAYRIFPSVYSDALHTVKGIRPL